MIENLLGIKMFKVKNNNKRNKQKAWWSILEKNWINRESERLDWDKRERNERKRK